MEGHIHDVDSNASHVRFKRGPSFTAVDAHVPLRLLTQELGSLLGISLWACLAVLDGRAELVRHGLGGQMQGL